MCDFHSADSYSSSATKSWGAISGSFTVTRQKVEKEWVVSKMSIMLLLVTFSNFPLEQLLPHERACRCFSWMLSSPFSDFLGEAEALAQPSPPAADEGRIHLATVVDAACVWTCSDFHLPSQASIRPAHFSTARPYLREGKYTKQFS